MYNSNYGYSASNQQPQSSLPLSSTPSNIRSQRFRFGYSGPAAYPRPRSSASKPNPEDTSESLRSQYEYSEDYSDTTRNDYQMTSDYNNTYQGEYPESKNYASTPARSNYGNTSDSYINASTRDGFGNADAYAHSQRGTTDSMVNNYGNSNNPSLDTSFPPLNNSFYSNNNSSTHSQNNSAYFTCNESFYESPMKPFLGNPSSMPLLYPPSKFPLQKSGYNADNKTVFQGRFQNKKDKFKATSSLGIKPKSIYDSRPKKKAMATKSEWRCTICSIDFTSSIPFDMHLRGAKHAKKLKMQSAVQSQAADNKEIAPVGNSFRCELCNITANSLLQLQTHLDGTKHKNKILQQQQPNEKTTEKDVKAASEVNGKNNGGAVVRPLPSDFDEPQKAKMCKLSCDICNITLNSEVQLQQHLTSKKHQAKVEGKPYPKRKFKHKKDGDGDEEKMETEQKTDNATEATGTQEPETANTGEVRKMVVGVKNLSASFVQGDTLQ